jgi:hypothetical protein
MVLAMGRLGDSMTKTTWLSRTFLFLFVVLGRAGA